MTGILFGLWPALNLSRVQAGPMMQSSARRVAGSVHGRQMHNILIAGQIAVTPLLAGAGSAMEGFLRLMYTPLGYEPHNMLWMGIPLHDSTYTTREGLGAYFEQLRAKVAETPGVTMAAISSNATPPRNGWSARFEILGKVAAEWHRPTWLARAISGRCVFRCSKGGSGARRRIALSRMQWSTERWRGDTFRTTMRLGTP